MIRTETPLRRARSNRRFVNAIIILMLLMLFLLVSSGGLIYYYLHYEPNPANTAHADPSETFNGLKKPIFYRGMIMEQEAIGGQEGLKIPFDVVNEWIDSNIFYEDLTESIIITTVDKVVRLKTGQLTGQVNETPFSLRFPIEKIGRIVYLPVTPFFEYYAVDLREDTQTGAVFLIKPGDAVQWGRVVLDPEHPEAGIQEEGEPPPSVPMRSGPSIKEPIYVDLPFGAELMIWKETADGWYHVQLENGYMGYVQKSSIVLTRVKSEPLRDIEENVYIPWKPLGGKINLTWEQVSNKTPDPGKFNPMEGLNVVSPTWFHLIDAEGNVNNLADPVYIKWAHENGLQIWGLFSNSFKPDWTTVALSSYDTRIRMIQQILAYAELYNLQGINVDFENVYLKDMANFTQFIREMAPFVHEQELVLSIDVTVRGGSAMWSLFADRRALGEVVDYMMVMTYDEFWGSSPVAGSVASLPWVEKGIADIIRVDGVPPSKLVLGIPYYTRIWTEHIADGITKVTSKAVSMGRVRSIIEDKQLTPVFLPDQGQQYVEYVENGDLNKIWMEDEVSLKARIDLVKKYNLAGIASWRRGLELPETWEFIANAIEARP